MNGARVAIAIRGVVLLAALASGCAGASGAPATTPPNPKVTALVMVHLEAGADGRYAVFRRIVNTELGLGPEAITTTSLAYQRALWPTTVRLVALADKYGVRLTLGLNPQWAEYVLQSDERVAVVREWKRRGHELAFQHHGINHLDWNGYTNRFAGAHHDDDARHLARFRNGGYRGTADEGFRWLQELGGRTGPPERVVTGTVTDTRIDKPVGITILTEGGRELPGDLISRPRKQLLAEGEMTWLRHAQLRSDFNDPGSTAYDLDQNHSLSRAQLQRFEDAAGTASNGDIVGVVFHEFDFYRFPDVYEDWFAFLRSRGIASRTASELVREYAR